MTSSAAETGAFRHALSVDVEDWYHDGGTSPRAGEERVERNVDRLLELFDAYGARATFFCLGEVAQKYPAMIGRIIRAGHEIGSHGYGHRPISELLRSEFREDVRRSLCILADVGGQPVRGYRAPYFSIKAGVRWPIETLADLGLVYDSSVLPIDRPPGLELVCPRSPYQHENGLWEVPVAILQMLFFWHLPLASGAGLRMVPPALLRRCLERFERDVGAGVFYLHPWEIDPESPTRDAAGRWLLKVGRRRLLERLESLLQEVSFAPIGEVFGDRMGVAFAPIRAATGVAS
jgi:polysaccharide deacetylase family protein (PEP-CTERM system associated)